MAVQSTGNKVTGRLCASCICVRLQLRLGHRRARVEVLLLQKGQRRGLLRHPSMLTQSRTCSRSVLVNDLVETQHVNDGLMDDAVAEEAIEGRLQVRRGGQGGFIVGNRPFNAVRFVRIRGVTSCN